MMSNKLSMQDVLSNLPITTVVYSSDGQVIAAGDSFWQACGLAGPVLALNKLGSLGSTLQHIADTEEMLEGHLVYRGLSGPLCITWRQVKTTVGRTVYACLIPDSLISLPNSVPAPSDTSSASGRDLPDPETTRNLLRRAASSCAKDNTPLCIARINISTTDNRFLIQVDREAWRNVGKKLRATCRMSDLVGVNEDGDYLVILINTKPQDAQAATRRVIGQLEGWSAANLAWPVRFTAGLATYQPGKNMTINDLLHQAGKECISVTSN